MQKRLWKLVIKIFKHFPLWILRACKTSSLRGITISLHCLIHLLHNQKSCTIKVQVNLRLQHKNLHLILHVIALYIFLCTLWIFFACIFVSYTFSSMFEICAFYETYIIVVARVDTFDCSLFFWRELLTGCPEALDSETFREEPLWRTTKNFQEPFSPSAFNVSLQIIPF